MGVITVFNVACYGAAFIGGLHSLLQDTAGCRAYLNCRLVANKRINGGLGLSHTFTVALIGARCNVGWQETSALLRESGASEQG